MKRGKSKRGQFYLMAAIIIIAVLIGISAYSNYAKTRKGFLKIYDLGKELRIETGFVYDYGTYKGEELNSLVEQWLQIYIDYTKGQQVVEDWIFVYGNENGIYAMTFTVTETGSVGLIIGGETTNVEIRDVVRMRQPLKKGTGGDVKLNFRGIEYDFSLEKGENFFFVIRGGEYVATE